MDDSTCTYMKVQLPTGDTTMIGIDSATTFAEIVQRVEHKKALQIEGASAMVLIDSKMTPVIMVCTMANYKNVAKVYLYGTVYSTAHPSGTLFLRPDKAPLPALPSNYDLDTIQRAATVSSIGSKPPKNKLMLTGSGGLNLIAARLKRHGLGEREPLSANPTSANAMGGYQIGATSASALPSDPANSHFTFNIARLSAAFIKQGSALSLANAQTEIRTELPQVPPARILAHNSSDSKYSLTATLKSADELRLPLILLEGTALLDDPLGLDDYGETEERSPDQELNLVGKELKDLRITAKHLTTFSNLDFSKQQIVVDVHLCDATQMQFKLCEDTTLEAVLHLVCAEYQYEYRELTIFVGLFKESAEMEKTLAYYSAKGPLIPKLHIVKGAKKYGTFTMSEGDREVLIYHTIEDRPKIMLATPDKLLDVLNDPTMDLDMLFLDRILLTFRSFSTTEILLNDLISRYLCRVPDNATEEEMDFFDQKQLKQQQRALNILEWWIEHHWQDFEASNRVRQRLKKLLDMIESNNPAFFYSAKSIREAAHVQHATFIKMLGGYNSVEGKKKKLDSGDFLATLDPQNLAQQLSLHNYNIFKNIHPMEFLNEIWKKDNVASASFSHLVKRFDTESYWVATELCMGNDSKTLKTRVKVLAKFISVAAECIQMNNFFSAFSIISGLNFTSTQRLKKTWEALPDKSKKEWESVEKLSDPSKNMKNYRDKLAVSVSPMVPFLPIYLKDLTFINDGNPSKINGLINVEKLRMMADCVLEISKLGAKPYNFISNTLAETYVSRPPLEMDQNKLKAIAATLNAE